MAGGRVDGGRDGGARVGGERAVDCEIRADHKLGAVELNLACARGGELPLSCGAVGVNLLLARRRQVLHDCAKVGERRAGATELSLELLGACVALEIVRARCAEPDHSEKADGEHESHDTDR